MEKAKVILPMLMGLLLAGIAYTSTSMAPIPATSGYQLLLHLAEVTGYDGRALPSATLQIQMRTPPHLSEQLGPDMIIWLGVLHVGDTLLIDITPFVERWRYYNEHKAEIEIQIFTEQLKAEHNGTIPEGLRGYYEWFCEKIRENAANHVWPSIEVWYRLPDGSMGVTGAAPPIEFYEGGGIFAMELRLKGLLMYPASSAAARSVTESTREPRDEPPPPKPRPVLIPLNGTRRWEWLPLLDVERDKASKGVYISYDLCWAERVMPAGTVYSLGVLGIKLYGPGPRVGVTTATKSFDIKLAGEKTRAQIVAPMLVHTGIYGVPAEHRWEMIDNSPYMEIVTITEVEDILVECMDYIYGDYEVITMPDTGEAIRIPAETHWPTTRIRENIIKVDDDGIGLCLDITEMYDKDYPVYAIPVSKWIAIWIKLTLRALAPEIGLTEATVLTIASTTLSLIDLSIVTEERVTGVTVFIAGTIWVRGTPGDRYKVSYRIWTRGLPEELGSEAFMKVAVTRCRQHGPVGP